MEATKSTIMNIDSGTVFIIVIWILAAFIIIAFIIFLTNLKNRRKVTCTRLAERPPKNLLPITADYDRPVNFYYIKTSFSSCSLGDYVGGYVDLCILEKIISQGVRCFDFEIFNIDENAVIATSVVNNTRIKESYNYIKFSDAFEMLATKAFNSLNCSNYTDPLFINLRMNTNTIAVFDNVASTLSTHDNELVEISQSYIHNDNKFFSRTPLNSLMNKIIIIVNSSSTDLENSTLKEYVSAYSGPSSSDVKQQTFGSVKADNKEDMILYNKLKTTFVAPDITSTPINPDPALCLSVGAQFIGMAYQKNDSNLQTYDNFFDEYKHAFILKNAELLPNETILNISVPDESSNPNQCNEIKMGDVVVSGFGSGCK